jgi:hypothetical protein
VSCLFHHHRHKKPKRQVQSGSSTDVVQNLIMERTGISRRCLAGSRHRPLVLENRRGQQLFLFGRSHSLWQSSHLVPLHGLLSSGVDMSLNHRDVAEDVVLWMSLEEPTSAHKFGTDIDERVGSAVREQCYLRDLYPARRRHWNHGHDKPTGYHTPKVGVPPCGPHRPRRSIKTTGESSSISRVNSAHWLGRGSMAPSPVRRNQRCDRGPSFDDGSTEDREYQVLTPLLMLWYSKSSNPAGERCSRGSPSSFTK